MIQRIEGVKDIVLVGVAGDGIAVVEDCLSCLGRRKRSTRRVLNHARGGWIALLHHGIRSGRIPTVDREGILISAENETALYGGLAIRDHLLLNALDLLRNAEAARSVRGGGGPLAGQAQRAVHQLDRGTEGHCRRRWRRWSRSSGWTAPGCSAAGWPAIAATCRSGRARPMRR